MGARALPNDCPCPRGAPHYRRVPDMSATSPGAGPAPLPPAILGQRYRLERRLAQGGMAEVWLATDLSLTRQVAVKLLKPSLAADPVLAERFRREAIAVAQLSHPNIVAVYDAIEEKIGGEIRQAVIMQLINGKSLRQLLDEQKRLSPDLTMHIGACVAAALDNAHQSGLVHRDVKPGNILVTPDGRVLLTDFGIAKGLDSDGDDLTSPNVMMGTAKYLSPEQVRGRRLDGRADLYSLGLVLYECLAGRVPFLGETDADTALARLNRDPTDLTRLRPTLPYGLAALIHRLLARKPDQRYATGAEVRNELQRIAALPRPDHTGTGDIAVGSGPVTRNTPPRGTRAGASGASSTSGATPTVPSGTPPGGQRSGPPAPGDPRRSSPVRPAGTPSNGLQARPGRPAGAPTRVDRTPQSTARARQVPNRRFEQRATPSLIVVGLLLAAAFVVGGLLWVTIDNDGGENPLPSTTVVGGVTSTTVAGDGGAVPAGPADIVAVDSFDPNGNGEERDELLSALLDNDLESGWSTVCYDNQYMGATQQVGVLADLGAPATGTLTVHIASAPYQLRVYTSAAEAPPTSFDGWGEPVERFADAEPGTVTAEVSTPARWLLVAFAELGPSSACSDNPYRGTLTELQFA